MIDLPTPKVRWRRKISDDKYLEYELPDIIPVDPSWKILGYIETEDFSLIGDPFFNVLAYRISDKGHHQWAIGWEHPLESHREKNPGFGFEDGFFLTSAEYIPVSYILGPLVGLEEVRMDRIKTPDVPDIAYVIDRMRFFKKPRWRFRGQTTWIDMEPWQEISKLRDNLDKRFLRSRIFQPNFNALAIGRYYERSHTLYLPHTISKAHFQKMLTAAVLLDVKAQVMMFDDRFTDPPADIIFFLFDSAQDAVVLINTLSKPRRMTWADVVRMARETQVWPVTAESLQLPVYPIQVVNTDTHTVSKL